MKEFWKSVKNWQSHRHEFGVLLFWDTVYFWFGKTNVRQGEKRKSRSVPPHWITPFFWYRFRPSLSTAFHSAPGYQLSSKWATGGGAMMSYRFSRWRPQRSCFLLPVSDRVSGDVSVMRRFNVYHPTKYRRNNSIGGCDITTSVSEKQKSTTLELRFQDWTSTPSPLSAFHYA